MRLRASTKKTGGTMDFPQNMRSLSISWFRKEDWPRWLSIDPDFDPDYQHWLVKSETAFKRITAMGHRVKKIIVDPDEFLEWSRSNGGKVDTQARSAFVAYKGMRKDTDH